MRINKVILGGRLTSDPELKQSTSGLSVCSFSIAVDRKFSKGEEKGCDFINITAWRHTAEFVSKYFKKGYPIIVVGELQTRSYEDKQKNKRTVTEVVADEVSFAGNKENTTEAKNEPYVPSAYSTQNSQNFEAIPGDESLPF
jgi:single-strand DNA-binding protein